MRCGYDAAVGWWKTTPHHHSIIIAAKELRGNKFVNCNEETYSCINNVHVGMYSCLCRQEEKTQPGHG